MVGRKDPGGGLVTLISQIASGGGRIEYSTMMGWDGMGGVGDIVWSVGIFSGLGMVWLYSGKGPGG